MKANQLLLATFLLVATPFVSKAQDSPKLQYTVGIGPSIDGMNFLYGVNLSNELNVRLGKRTSFNTAISFYQSLGSYRESKLELGKKNMEQSSGIFFTPSIEYVIVQSPSGFNLAISAGPSLQLGGETFLYNYNLDGTIPDYPTYVTNKYQRVGVMTELEAEWNSKNPNLKNAIGLSAYGADNAFPWYVNLTYKLRFGLGKN